MRDLYANLAAVPALAPAVQTAAAQGAAIDLNAKGGVAFVVNTGAIAGAGDFGLTLQESDTGTSGWTAERIEALRERGADRVVLDPARIGVFVDDWRIAPLTQASAA